MFNKHDNIFSQKGFDVLSWREGGNPDNNELEELCDMHAFNSVKFQLKPQVRLKGIAANATPPTDHFSLQTPEVSVVSCR